MTFQFLHVLSVLVLFMGQGLIIPNGILASRSESAAAVRTHLSLMKLAEDFLILPAAVAIPITGWLIAWRAEISLGETWLTVAQTLYFAAFIVGLVYLRPLAIRLARQASDLPDGAAVPSDLRAALHKPLPAFVGNTLFLTMIVILYLMVFTPWEDQSSHEEPHSHDVVAHHRLG